MKIYIFILLAATFGFVSNAQTVTTLQNDGVMLKSGQPFFPIGLYNFGEAK